MTLTFETGYRNLFVVGPDRGFCLLTGVHDPGFPWGDPSAATDLVLVAAPGGEPRRFVAGGETLEAMVHDVAGGRFTFRGPGFEMPAGVWRAGFADLDAPETLGLIPVTLDVSLELEVTPLESGTLHVPFVELAEKLRGDHDFGEAEATLGMVIDTAAVRVSGGHVRVETDSPLDLDPAGARGESERGDYVGLRRPPIRYHYVCGVLPEGDGDDGVIAITTDVLDPGGGGLVEDTVAHVASSFFRAVGDVVQTWRGETADARDPGGESPVSVVEPICKLVWDHLETGAFERKVVWLERGGERFLGCEEDMMLRRAYGDGSRSQAIEEVIAVRDADAHAALDAVLEATGFDELVRARAAAFEVDLAELRVAVKPNFMFMYSTNDPSTYTRPDLVLRLIDRLRELGCRDIAIVEAQSAYGNYFEGREVRRVAEYIGYGLDDERFRVADLTEEMAPFDYGNQLGHHGVGETWRDAQLRISFAKNKTHTWSYYTLGLKNTYGALPMQDKLREYHDVREIYYPTIDALRHFPVHYCLIDASLSADGQFGIFADRHPNQTDTIIGGRDIIATDWFGAEKMGLDPMISRYMREATFAFGKPEIVRRGDRSRYPSWRNVERAMTEFWDRAEEHYGFSDLIFRVLNEMDGHFPRKKDPWYVRLFRFLFGWARGLVFKKTRPPFALPEGHPPTAREEP